MPQHSEHFEQFEQELSAYGIWCRLLHNLVRNRKHWCDHRGLIPASDMRAGVKGGAGVIAATNFGDIRLTDVSAVLECGWATGTLCGEVAWGHILRNGLLLCMMSVWQENQDSGA
jgi:hypothetical protein